MTDRYGGSLDLHLACLDLRKIEDVIDDSQERVGRLSDCSDNIRLIMGQLRLSQHFDHADDPIHWGADLVAHRREEGTLGP
ncbi:hypothetical protein D3C87_1415690 [compost metagenome]